jgi:hypothetical protein
MFATTEVFGKMSRTNHCRRMTARQSLGHSTYTDANGDDDDYNDGV